MQYVVVRDGRLCYILCMGAGYSSYDLRERAILALDTGQGMVDVAQAYQVDYSTLFRWRQRYRKMGLDGLHRREAPGSGRPHLVSDEELQRLVDMVLRPASEFGYETDLWTCRRLMEVLAEHLNVRVSQPTMWRMLRDSGMSYQKPERQYMEADEQARQRWLRYQLPKILQVTRKHRAILYFEDESNISLTPFLGKTWARVGQTPLAYSSGARTGLSAMSAISKSGQLVFRLHDKRIASAEVINFLAQLLRHHKRRHVVVVMDQAPPHTSKKTRAFIENQKRLHVFYLPKYSPDFNPDEYVWNHLKHQELKAHQAKTKDELRQLAHSCLRKMKNNHSLLRGIFFRCYIADFMN